MKKVTLIFFFLILIAAAIAAWIFLGAATAFSSPKAFLYIRSNANTKKAVLDSLEKNKIVTNTTAFAWLANKLHYWQNIKPGKYEIKKGSSLLTIARLLRNGKQVPVNLVITKLRTKEDFARLVGHKFETDSIAMMDFLNSPDSLKKFDEDTISALAAILPDTYIYTWNSTPQLVYQKLWDESKKFWTDARQTKAQNLGLTTLQAYILSSIIEEETTNNAEKGTIASVYLNRMRKGMPLQADPTIKFALKNFALKRIYEKYLFVESPYNTYRNKGLPPGPICTPSKKTIDAVLNAPVTDYLYFVASADFKQAHEFSATYEEHLKKAKLYQQELNKRDSIKKANL